MAGSKCRRLVAKCFLSLLALIYWTACSSKPAHQHTQQFPETQVPRDVLKNGLTIIFVEDHSAPVISYRSWFRVGSAGEKKGATVIAHLFEHLMFKGTERYGKKQFI